MDMSCKRKCEVQIISHLHIGKQENCLRVSGLSSQSKTCYHYPVMAKCKTTYGTAGSVHCKYLGR